MARPPNRPPTALLLRPAFSRSIAKGLRLSIVSTAIAAGILWGSGILLVGLVNLARPEYGTNFLMMMNSVYPWFHSSHSIGSVMIGTVDGFLDGLVAGCLFGWFYNLALSISQKTHLLEGRHV